MNPNRLDELNRRDFLSRTARTCFGLTIGGSVAKLFDSPAFAADATVLKAGGGKAKHVIYLYMSGGMTHIDTFDPKPDAPVRCPRPGQGDLHQCRWHPARPLPAACWPGMPTRSR